MKATVSTGINLYKPATYCGYIRSVITACEERSWTGVHYGHFVLSSSHNALLQCTLRRFINTNKKVMVYKLTNRLQQTKYSWYTNQW